MSTYENWNTGWIFSKCNRAEIDPGKLFHGEEVSLPHTWYADGDYYQGDGVYQKLFTVQQPSDDKRYYLRFDGVDKCCDVYLNGIHIGSHEGAYNRFALEAGGEIKTGENLLTVLVNNEKGETVSPLSGDFTIFGGIYRKTELLVTESVCFDRAFYGTDGVLFRTNGTNVTAEPHLAGRLPEDAVIRYRITAPDGTVVTQCSVGTAEAVTITVEDPVLWDGRKHPYLYTAAAEIVLNGEMLDCVSKRIGLRGYRVDPDQGFFLNGRHLKLHGVAKHQDTAGVYSAATEEHWKTDMDLIGEIGANTVRLSHYPHPQAIYDLCDEMGLIVWAEIPLLKLTMSDALLENAKYQLTELIYQNLHHPSICFWGIQNEIAIFGEKPYMTERLTELNDLAHKLDGSRITTSSNLNSVLCSSPLNHITDIQAYNVYFGWYYGTMPDHAAFLDEFHRVNPGVPLGISEYGVDCNPQYHSDEPKVNDYTEEYQCKYHETVYPYMAERDFVWGSYVWNMFDFVSAIRNAGGVFARNIKGLVTHDRKIRKDAFYYYKAQWSDEPFVHIAEKRFALRTGNTMNVKVYSNQKTVVLEADGRRRSCSSDTGVFLFTGIPLSSKGTEVTAAAGEWKDHAVFTQVEMPEESYIYVDREPGLNVRNWFVDEAEEARMFPEDAYSLRDTMDLLVENSEVMETIRKMTPSVYEMMQDTVLSFTLEQAIRHERPDCTEEQAKELNHALTQIPKIPHAGKS